MPSRIYDPNKQPLDTLLSEGSSDATLLIPDLQRPFDWQPSQVRLLVDSLIKGWPFGTLLLWKVSGEHLDAIPARGFWTLVDRTPEEKGQEVTRKQNPATYRMVLDGQQRLQALLFAVAGDGWGFKLLDKDWGVDQGKERRGKAPKHWSIGQLCLNLEEFERELKAKRSKAGGVIDVDYNTALEWVVCGAKQDGLSAFNAPPNYIRPLPVLEEHRGKYIRFSRLWALADTEPGVEHQATVASVLQVLTDYQVDPAKHSDYANTLAELVRILAEVKSADVSFLELAPFNPKRNRNTYDDAIVNIFTRLNTAGTPLTGQEITFAWIKRRWDLEKTGKQTAEKCFMHLGTELAKHGITLKKMDELVRTVSHIWAVLRNNGDLLTPRDFLRSNTMGAMATHLSECWSRLVENFVACAAKLTAHGLTFREHFESLNSVIVLCAWHMIALEWRDTQKLSGVPKDNFHKQLDTLLAKHIDRWILLTQWAGDWAASGKAIAAYVKRLSKEYEQSQKASDPATVIAALDNVMKEWLTTAQEQASKHILDLDAGARRADVRSYYTPLWVWHQLDATRWKFSEDQLKIKSRTQVDRDVDHIVAFGYWETDLKAKWRAADAAVAAAAGGATDDSTVDAEINGIGNCFLLWKNFNISKLNRPLEALLDQIQEFKTDTTRKDQWCKALDIPDALLNPKNSAPEAIRTEIILRGERITAELLDFVSGKTNLQS